MTTAPQPLYHNSGGEECIGLEGKLGDVQAELNGLGPEQGYKGLVVPRGRQAATRPDFLWDLVALSHFMRLSVKKGAHAARSNAAWQEIRGGRT